MSHDCTHIPFIHEFNDLTSYYCCKMGVRHREDGPAYVCKNKEYNIQFIYYLNGEINRANGPAITYFSGHEVYFYRGKILENIKSTKELLRYIKLTAFE